MQPVMRRGGGFGLLEMMVVVIIIGLTLAVGMPRLSEWSMANKAASAAEFYADGVRTARAEAVRHNAASRLVLGTNADSGQMDWRVDLCFPSSGTPCSGASGDWSSVTKASKADPEGDAGFHSVLRSASNLPKTDILQASVEPTGATTVYFTPVGWVDTTVPARLARIDLEPASAHAQAFPASAVLITLAGNAVKCNPDVAAGDSRSCQ